MKRTQISILACALVTVTTLGACGIPDEKDIAGATTTAMKEDSTRDTIAAAVQVALANGASVDAIATAVADALGEAAVAQMIQDSVAAALASATTGQVMEDAMELALAKTTLSEKIGAAKGMVAVADEGTFVGQYSAGSKATLQTAITAAEAVDNNPAATLQQVKDASESLTVAMAVFGSELVVKSISSLLSQISSASALLSGVCTAAGATSACNTTGNAGFDGAADSLQSAIDGAQGVADDPNATQSDVNGATSGLADASSSFCTSGFGGLPVSCP